MIERILELMKRDGINAAELSKIVNVGTTTISAWKKGLQKPSAEAITKLADHFNVQTDYLLGRTDHSTPQILNIPEALHGVAVAFHRGEFEDLTQDEVDSLARIAMEYKSMREKHSKPS